VRAPTGRVFIVKSIEGEPVPAPEPDSQEARR
jgi:hypothetical protein